MTIKNPKILEHFESQANACANMGSLFTSKLCTELPQLLDTDSTTGSRIEHWQNDPGADALALRLCGALQSIVITNPDDPLNRIYPDGTHPEFKELLKQALKIHDSTLEKWLDLPPQTNETGRAAALLPGLLEVSRHSQLPIRLIEIGSSAGLNLQLNHFHYDYDGATWGDPDSPVKLRPEVRGKGPDLNGELNIASAIGCDIAPIDIQDEFQRLRLMSYIWPDQHYRAIRIRGAIELALKHQPELHAMDAAEFVIQQLEQRPDNQAFVLMHSVVWQYLPEETKQKIEAALNKFGSQSTKSNPIYRLQMEGFDKSENFARLVLDSWPNHQSRKLAKVCYHCNWVDFSATDNSY